MTSLCDGRQSPADICICPCCIASVFGLDLPRQKLRCGWRWRKLLIIERHKKRPSLYLFVCFCPRRQCSICFLVYVLNNLFFFSSFCHFHPPSFSAFFSLFPCLCLCLCLCLCICLSHRCNSLMGMQVLKEKVRLLILGVSMAKRSLKDWWGN